MQENTFIGGEDTSKDRSNERFPLKQIEFQNWGDKWDSLLRVKLSDIVLDPDIQAREKMIKKLILEYAHKIKSGLEFPPIILFFIEGKYFVADGFHRIEAHKKAGMNEIWANVFYGSKRDAFLFAVSANLPHGRSSSDKDRRKAAEKLLRDEEWRQLSNPVIAKKCGCSHKTVGRIRKRLVSEGIIMPSTRKGQAEIDTIEAKIKAMEEKISELEAENEILREKAKSDSRGLIPLHEANDPGPVDSEVQSIES